ncbi:MAG TPA: hypothetical protein VII45_12805, partial [Solirubrobacterales bacterium]
TTSLPHDIPASGGSGPTASLENALNALEAIKAGGGSVSVSGGPGSPGGTTPYLISFDGGPLGGADQPLLRDADGSPPLSGAGATADVVTTNPGATGFEICEAAEGDVCKQAPASEFAEPVVGGRLTNPASVAVDQVSGDVYAASDSRVSRFSATGQFLRAWGGDVVRSGPDNSNVDEQQEVTVSAGVGTFTLNFGGICSGCPHATTGAIPYNAPASGPGSVEEALDNLFNIGGENPPGFVSVTGGPGDPGGNHPYLISFEGSLAGDNLVQLSSSATGLAGGTATVSTVADGGAPEVCTDSDVCQQGQIDGRAGYLGEGAQYLAVAPNAAPNAGDVLVAEAFTNSRVQEFTPSGVVVRMFGFDVVKSGPDDAGTGFEVCVPANGDVCKAGISGTGIGQFASQHFRGIAEGPSGAIYTAEGRNIGGDSGASPSLRVQKFTPGGGLTLTPSLFGTDEVQAVTVNAGGGGFRLAATDPYGTTGTGICNGGNETVTGFRTKTGEFTLGQPIFGSPEASGYITAVGPSTISLSKRLSTSSDSCSIVSPRHDDTGGVGSGSLSGGSSTVTSVVGGRGTANLGTIASGDVTNGSNTIHNVTVPGGDFLGSFVKGDPINGPGIPPGATITEISTSGGGGDTADNHLAISTNATASATAAALTVGSTLLTSVNTTSGQFAVGESITGSSIPPGTTIQGLGVNSITLSQTTATAASGVAISSGAHFAAGEEITGPGIPPGTTINSVGAGALTLSQPAEVTASENDLASDLPHDASASQVEAALNDLPAISASGGSVSVSGGPGDPGGSHPYLISFDGGPLARTDPPQLVASDNAAPLSGGTGPGADTASVETTVPGGPKGIDERSTPLDVTVGPGERIFVAENSPQAEETCPGGLPSPGEMRIQELDSSGAVLRSSAPCDGIGTPVFHFGPSIAVNPATGTPYLIDEGFHTGGNKAYVFGPVVPPTLGLNALSNLSPTGVTVSGTISPNGPGVGYAPNADTSYRVEYKKPVDINWTTYAPDISVGAGFSAVPFSVGVSGLTPNTTYEVRVVLSSVGAGTITALPQTVTTLSAAPTVSALSSSSVTVGSADLHAAITPQGSDTTYHFEYGPTRNYGQSTPEADVGESQDPVAVQAHIEGLEPVVYHFRVVAHNALGTTTSGDQTFNFYPEPCPNAAVRQQTGAAALPDCRAYEIVSPGDAGTALLLVGGPTSPLASNPPRVSFLVNFGVLPGPWNPPPNEQDLYAATRTAGGWRTSYVGIQAQQTIDVGGPPNRSGPYMADLNLDKFLDWEDASLAGCCGKLGSFAPYMWDAQGQSLGRLPSNLAAIPGG